MKKILFATILFGLLSCEKEVSIEDQIVGTWYTVSYTHLTLPTKA